MQRHQAAASLAEYCSGAYIFYGLQTVGEIEDVVADDDEVKFWSNIAYVTGGDDGDDIRGFGFDVFGTYVFARDFEPSLTLGFAYGSGDNNSSNSVDHNFRQTGLQDNNAKFNGKTSFRYYGEVFDPELSNMLIYTAGAGIRPTKESSIDLVYHRYRQVHPDDDIRDSNLEADPNGESSDLGQEVDVILGWIPRDDLKFEIELGAFLPGTAFVANADNAYSAFGEIRYRF